MSGLLWGEWLKRHPEISECGACGLPVHESETEAHMRFCLDDLAAGRSES